ncbi:MAG: hypothetical protein ACLFP4_09555 [Spirochaetales bacterium]
MKRTVFKAVFAVMIVAMLLVPVSLSAQTDAIDEIERGGFGFGVMLGEPSGVSLISWLGGANALDFVAAWSFENEGSFYFQADYQFHSFVERPLTVFFGAGGFVRLEEDPNFGFRIPVGLTYLFENAPFDVFIKAAPGMSLVPATEFTINGGIGFRFYP